jgi:hypothetical protein
MISWKDRRRIAEEQMVRQAAIEATSTPHWKRILNTTTSIINSPIILAVVVSSIIAFVVGTFRQYEVCQVGLTQANDYWKQLNIELEVRLYERELAVEKEQPSDIDSIVNVFILRDYRDLPQDKHVSELLRKNTFPKLILRFKSIKQAFSIPQYPEDSIFATMLNAGLLAPKFVILSGVDAPGPSLDVVALRETRPDTVKIMLQNAVTHFYRTRDNYPTLPYECELLGIVKREILLQSSPFAKGIIPVHVAEGFL